MKKIVLFCLVLLVLLPFSYSAEFNAINFAACDNDGVCDSGEDKCSCAGDCGTCSGNVAGEVCQEYNCLTGLCRAQVKYYCCGNHICESGEDFSNCDADCAPSVITVDLLSPDDLNVFLRGDEIVFVAEVKADGVAAKLANVRVRTPFAGDIPMYDDGNHSDKKANDGVYGVSFLVSELTPKNNFVSEIFAEKLGVTATHDFIVKVNPSLSMNFSVDKNIFVLGETIHFTGSILKRGKPVSTVITFLALNKDATVFEAKANSDANGFFSLDQRTSLYYPEGNWVFRVTGKDGFENEGLLEKKVVVSKEAGTIFMDVVFSSSGEELYYRGEELKVLVDVLFDENPVEDAEVTALFPDGKEVALKMVSKGKYSLSYFLPFDFPLGEQAILVNAKKTIDNVKYGGSNELDLTFDNAKINAFLLEPTKQTVALGEEIGFMLKFSYDNGKPLSKAKIEIKVNDKNITASEKEPGVFYFSYVVKNEDLSDSRQLLLNVLAVDAFGNSVEFNRLFEVSGEITLEYYFRQNPLLFLSVIFGFVFVILVIVVVKNRLNTLGSLMKRKKELEKIKGDLQEKYFNLGAMSNEQYYSLLEQYGSELRNIESAIESFRKAEKGKKAEPDENEVFGKKDEAEDVVPEKKDSFDDAEMDSMFRVKEKKGSEEEDEDVPPLFSLPKKNSELKKDSEPKDSEEKKEKNLVKKKKPKEVDELWD